MIKSFHCKNFKNITTDNLEFEKINILIGPNNAGKSNFIRAISFCANMVNGAITEKSGLLSEIKRNGWDEMLNKSSGDSSIEFEWKMALNDRNMDYKLKIHVGENINDFYILHESLHDLNKPDKYDKPFNYFDCHMEQSGVGIFSSAGKIGQQNKRFKAQISREETILLQFEKVFFDNPSIFSSLDIRKGTLDVLNEMRDYFKSFFSYSSATFNISDIRQLRDKQDNGTILLKDGSNFVNVFQHYSTVDPSFEDRFSKKIRDLIPDIENVKVENALGKLGFQIQKNGKTFMMSEVSDGTVKALILVMLLCVPASEGLSMLAVDEPEMNLHPAWQKLIAKMIQLSGNFKQCFVSTHSPDFLDEFTEGFREGRVGVFVFDSKNEGIKKLNKNDLMSDIIDWTLGDLYRVNDPLIGGWPW